jgi:S1-C subfamily serine protease
LQDGTTREATVLGKDDATDIAVIKIDASYLGVATADSAAGGATVSSVAGGGPASAAGLHARHPASAELRLAAP